MDLETVIRDQKFAIGECDPKELRNLEEKQKLLDGRMLKERESHFQTKIGKIQKTELKTEKDLEKRSKELAKIIDLKEDHGSSNFSTKENVLVAEFDQVFNKLKGKIDEQKNHIQQKYGSLNHLPHENLPAIFQG